MQRLPGRELVLIGAGHTNLHVVRMWLQRPIADVQLTVVSPTPYATYSGMFPGTLAGLYSADAMLIDLDQLTHAAKARLIVAECTGLSVDKKEVLLKGRPSIRFDVASVGVGSQPAGLQAVSDHPGLVSVKPMFTTVHRLRSRLQLVADRRQSDTTQSTAGTAVRSSGALESSPAVRLVVVGGGAAGVEIAFCVQQFVRHEFPQLCRHGAQGQSDLQVTIVDSHDHVLQGYRPRTVNIAQRELRQRGIEVMGNRRVIGCQGKLLILSDGSQLAADVVIWCAGAAPIALLQNISLPRCEGGFLRVHPTLQSVANVPVFAVGDSASIDGENVPRAGVFAVRQGPVLWQNICRMFVQQPLQPYRPQRDFLSLLATGDGRAIGQYRRLSFYGGWLWRLKNHIDTKFMNMHRPTAAQMTSAAASVPPAESAGATPENQQFQMRCHGCGGKTSARVLSTVLQRLRGEHGTADPDFLQAEDAVILSPEQGVMNAVSVDMFTSFVNDPWIVGRVAAIHSLSDLWARAIQPTAAMAMIIIPSGPYRAQVELLHQLLSGVITELKNAGVVLAGGHTMDGDELTIGLTVLGKAGVDDARGVKKDSSVTTDASEVAHTSEVAHGASQMIQADPAGKRISKAGLRAGQKLILTKPLGTGVILAGREIRLRAAATVSSHDPHIRTSAAAVKNAVQTMLQSNQSAIDAAVLSGVTGVTDITGFGLAGHLLEMLDASSVSAQVMLDQIPLIDGASQLFDAGIRSSLDMENRLAESRMIFARQHQQTAAWHALFDPQTSGGLLVGVDENRCDQLLAALQAAGYREASVIGQVMPGASTGMPGRLAGVEVITVV